MLKNPEHKLKLISKFVFEIKTATDGSNKVVSFLKEDTSTTVAYALIDGWKGDLISTVGIQYVKENL
eukprot:Pgem_evm1s3083